MDLQQLPKIPKSNAERDPSKGVPFYDALPADIQLKLQNDPEFQYFFGWLLTQFFARQRQYAEENNEELIATANRVRNNSQNKGPQNDDNLFYYLVDRFETAGVSLNKNRERHIHTLLDLSYTLTTEFVEYAKQQSH